MSKIACEKRLRPIVLHSICLTPKNKNLRNHARKCVRKSKMRANHYPHRYADPDVSSPVSREQEMPELSPARIFSLYYPLTLSRRYSKDNSKPPKSTITLWFSESPLKEKTNRADSPKSHP